MDYVEILSWIMRKFYHGVYGYFIMDLVEILLWITGLWKFYHGCMEIQSRRRRVVR